MKAISIKIDKILVYYDAPEICLASDAIGTKYICILCDEKNGDLKYLSVSISNDRLYLFYKNKYELREIFKFPEMGMWYTFIASTISTEGYFELEMIDVIDENWLPDEGFVFEPYEIINEELARDTIKINKPLFDFDISQNGKTHKVSAEALAAMLSALQKTIKYGYRKAISEFKQEKRQLLDYISNYLVDVVAFQPGSLDVRLVSDSQSDLFGNSYIEYAFERLDQFLTPDIDDENDVIEVLRNQRGHLLTSYKQLLQIAYTNDIEIKYTWILPNMKTNKQKIINRIYAGKMLEIMNKRKELGIEEITITGYVMQADVDSKKWRMISEIENKEYIGESVDVSLSGIVLETQKYEFVCEEKTEESIVSEVEKNKYILKSLRMI